MDMFDTLLVMLMAVVGFIPNSGCFIVPQFSTSYVKPYGDTVEAGSQECVTFTSLPDTVDVAENVVIGTVIYTVAPVGGIPAYSCSVTQQQPENGNKRFGFSTFDIETILDLDYEDITQFILTIKCSDSDTVVSTGTSSLTVNIEDVNDHSPVISGPLSVSMDEEQSLGSVITPFFTAVDGDPTDVLTYSLTGSDTGYFQISPASGVISVIARLDRDYVGARIVYNDLLLSVTDRWGVSATASLTVNIMDLNDNIPTFSPPVYFITVSENTSPGQNLLTLACVDSDETPGNGDVTYAIASGDDGTPKFSLSGNVLVTSGNNIDYEALFGQGYMYQLIIIGTDGGTTPNTGTASVIVQVDSVNEEEPIWSTFTPAYIDPNTPYDILENVLPGTTVITVLALDGDHGVDGLITYSIVSTVDDSSNVAGNMFRTDPVSGELQTIVLLERDGPAGVAYYDVTVRASDHGSPAKTVDRSVRVALVDVNDNAPAFSTSLYEVSIIEDAPVSTSVLTLAATDDDVTHNLTFSIISGNTGGKFQLSPGAELQIQTVIDLDVSDPSSYVLVVSVVDGGTPELTSSATVVISVTPTNDHDPVLQPIAGGYTVPEDATAGYAFLALSATDDDQQTEQNGTYSIFSGGSGHFGVGTYTGNVELIKEIDYEALIDNVMEVVVVVSDEGGRTDTGTVTITITDSNDHSPSCTETALMASLTEDAYTGTPIDILNVNCSDADITDNLIYSISSGDLTSSFSVTSSGVLQLTSDLDYETVSEYDLVLEISDGKNKEEVYTVLSVLPVNEGHPVFSPVAVNVTWAEDTPAATTLITYTATDTDTGQHGTVIYSISTVSQGGGSLFAVDYSAGDLILLQHLDYESLPVGEKYYTLVITGTDGGGLQATGTVSVFVTDVNDNIPICVPMYREITVVENTAAGSLPLTLVSSLSCSDVDQGAVGNLSYSLIQSPGGSQFTVSFTTGTVSLVSALDYETAKLYMLSVIVTDTGMPAIQTCTVTIAVSVTNVNDGGPVFPVSGYMAAVLESVSLGQSVFDIPATDPDDPDTPEGKMIYSILSGNYNEQFAINTATGRLVVNKPLDRETMMLYTLQVEALEDVGTNSAVTTVNITVSDVNDNAPSCPSIVMDVSVSENAAVNDVIVTFTCTDVDGGVVTYSISSGDTSVFDILASNLVLKSLVDYDVSARFYHLIITASDGALDQDIQVTVKVNPFNEYTPAFTSGSYGVVVAEDTELGVQVAQVTATDTDTETDGFITYSMTAHPKFYLEALTGEIILQDYLDYETSPAYNLQVIAADMGVPAKTGTCTVVITVTDINENAPSFVPKAYAGYTFSDNSPVETTVLSLTGVDSDGGVYGDLTYSLISGNTGNVFRVEKNIGSGECDIIVNDVTNLNDDVTPSYNLIVRATDGGGLFAETSVSLTVTGLNEYSPVFTPPPTSTIYLSEVTPVNTVVLDMAATDADSGQAGQLTFSLASGAMSTFTIHPATGLITVSGLLDAEAVSSYILSVVASDGGVNPSSLSATFSLTIQVTDVNDNAPVCLWSSFTVTVSESAPLSTSVTLLPCTDPDGQNPNNLLTFSVVEGTGAGLFNVHPSTGELTTAASYDRETLSHYNLTIQVADQGFPSLTASTDVNIIITDENDNDPQFCCSPHSIVVDENVVTGTSLYQLTATDIDGGIYGTVIYSIQSGNTGNKFAVDGLTGEIKTVGLLDRETVSSYSLMILASDAGSPPRTASASVTIDVIDANDNPPYCNTAVYHADITYNVSVYHSVLFMSCADVDQGTTITYTLMSTSVPFSVNSTTGEIQVSASLIPTSITNYTLFVIASDGTFSVNITVVIDVFFYNTVAPVFSPPGPYTVNIFETRIKGTVVTQLSAADSNHPNSFSITGGNTGNVFEMNPVTGVIQTKRTIDYEAISVYELEVRLTDLSTISLLSTSTTLTVSLLDANDNVPVCIPDQFNPSVLENHTGVVVTVNCTDEDVSSVVTYSIMSSHLYPSFNVDSVTGQLVITGMLDFENTTAYDIAVEATDSLLTSTVLVLVTVVGVNEHDPEFSAGSYPITVDEDTSPGTAVLIIIATDQDAGQHGSLRYSILSGNSENKFLLDSMSGILTLAKRLDREHTTSYSLVISAADCEGVLPETRTANVGVTVTVKDSNDNFPLFTPVSYQVSALESVPSGSILLTLTATDDDEGQNSNIIFSILSGNAAGIFSVSGNLFEISSGKGLDYDMAQFHQVIVEARDNGTTYRATQTRVIVAVLPVNEFTPYMQVNSTVTIAEDTVVGTVIFTVSATDNDTASADDVVYSVIAGNSPGSPFYIDPLTGQVQVWSALDFDIAPIEYSMEILAQDDAGSGTGFSSTTTLSVLLTDVNDQTPVFMFNIWSFTFEENATISTPIGTVMANDTDTGLGGEIYYTILSGNTSLFSVDNMTGVIRTASAGLFDYETKQRYSMMISATDSGIPQHSSQCLVYLSLLDINDNPPVFPQLDVTLHITEDVPVGSAVITVGASDLDSGLNGVITYSLSPSSYFSINLSSGTITTTSGLDRESIDRHIAEIVAADHGSPPLSATSTLTVVLLDVNDHTPVVNGTYDYVITEDSAPGTEITRMITSDEDIDENAALTFTIISGNFNNSWAIDSDTGIVTQYSSLDRESLDMYYLVVSVSDHGRPARSTSVTVMVSIQDVNDNLPLFASPSYNFDINEYAPTGSPVGTMAASDADTGLNGQVEYSLVSIDVGLADFSVNKVTGDIVSVNPLDREGLDFYVYVFRAADKGSPRLFTDVQVNITITDYNDNAPVFTDGYNVSISENTTIGTSILQMSASDMDIGLSATLVFNIDNISPEGVRANQLFAVNYSTGLLITTSILDRETEPVLEFGVIATDLGTPSLSSSTTLTVILTDVNDNPPVMDKLFENVEIAYDGQCSDNVTTVSASDPDEGMAAYVRYYFRFNDTPAVFSVGESSGAVLQIGEAEVNKRYIIEVVARDNGEPVLTSVEPFVLRVDSLDLGASAVSLVMTVSREYFTLHEQVFLTNLTALFKTQYPSAVAKLWCVENIEPATPSPTQRRRLLTTGETPVMVHIYIVQDNSTDSSDNIDMVKNILSVTEAMSFLVDSFDGSVLPELSGWSDFGIFQVLPYREIPSVVETPISAVIVGFSIVGGLMFFVLIAIGLYCKMKPARSCRYISPLVKNPDKRTVLPQSPEHVYPLQRQQQTEKSFFGEQPDAEIRGQNRTPKSPLVTKRVIINHDDIVVGPAPDRHLLEAILNAEEPVPTPEKILGPPGQTIHDKGDMSQLGTVDEKSFSALTFSVSSKVEIGQEVAVEKHSVEKAEIPVAKTSPSAEPSLPKVLSADVKLTSQPTLHTLDEQVATVRDSLASVVSRQHSIPSQNFDKQSIDPETGRMYEYNSATLERRWMETADGEPLISEDFKQTDQTEEPDAQSVGPSESQLSSGSYDAVELDQETGQMYQYNSTTLKTKWMSNPDGSPMTEDDYNEKHKAQVMNTEAIAGPISDKESLPRSSTSVWEVATDPDSGQMYEYNTVTMETRWIQTSDGKPVSIEDFIQSQEPEHVSEVNAVVSSLTASRDHRKEVSAPGKVSDTAAQGEGDQKTKRNSLASSKESPGSGMVDSHYSSDRVPEIAPSQRSSPVGELQEAMSEELRVHPVAATSHIKSSVTTAGQSAYSSSGSVTEPNKTSAQFNRGRRAVQSEEMEPVPVASPVKSSMTSVGYVASLQSSPGPSTAVTADVPSAREETSDGELAMTDTLPDSSKHSLPRQDSSSLTSVGSVTSQHSSPRGNFDTIASDPVSGQMYKYNSETLATEWLESPGGRPVLSDDFKQIIHPQKGNSDETASLTETDDESTVGKISESPERSIPNETSESREDSETEEMETDQALLLPEEPSKASSVREELSEGEEFDRASSLSEEGETETSEPDSSVLSEEERPEQLTEGGVPSKGLELSEESSGNTSSSSEEEEEVSESSEEEAEKASSGVVEEEVSESSEEEEEAEEESSSTAKEESESSESSKLEESTATSSTEDLSSTS